MNWYCSGDVSTRPGLPAAPGMSGTSPSSDKKSANSTQNPANSSTEIRKTTGDQPTYSGNVVHDEEISYDETKTGLEDEAGISPDSSQQGFGSEIKFNPPTTSFSGLGRLDLVESTEQTNSAEKQTNSAGKDNEAPSGINAATAQTQART